MNFFGKPLRTFPDHARPHPALIAGRAEMLVDAENDQDQFRDDAREHDTDDDEPAMLESSTRNPLNGLIAIAAKSKKTPERPNSARAITSQ
jgi:hypothetical protein